jgi:hypothetical protein
MYGYRLDPPQPKEPIIYTCDECGVGIYDGQPYYCVVGAYFCVRCMEENKRTASEDDLMTDKEDFDDD